MFVKIFRTLTFFVPILKVACQNLTELNFDVTFCEIQVETFQAIFLI